MSGLINVSIPRIRPEVQLVETGDSRFPWALIDPSTQIKLPLDPIGRLVAESLRTPNVALDILGIAHQQGEDRLDPVLLHKHVRIFARYGLLDGERARRISNSKTTIETGHSLDPDTVEMVYPKGLRHACQSCGSCCSATDVGPIDPSVVADVKGGSFHEHISGIEHADDLFRVAVHEGEEIHLTEMRNDQCVFLGADKLCLIHKEFGIERKPNPCRQFPFVFSQIGDRVAVSVQMECRAYWRAKQAARPIDEEEVELRELLRIGVPVHQIQGPIQVDPGLVISEREYLVIEQTLIDAIRDSRSTDAGIFGPLVAFARAANSAMEELYRDIDAEETSYLSTAVWAAAFPAQFSSSAPGDSWKNFFQQLEVFFEEATSFSREAADVALERELPWLSQRFSVFGHALRASSGTLDPTAFHFRDQEACVEILEDVLVSGLSGKETIRNGRSLRFGLGVLGLRALLTLNGACWRAKEACRIEVTVQDLIDTMVTISKMLRERSVVDLLSSLRDPLETLFVRNLEVFSQAAEPRSEDFGGLR